VARGQHSPDQWNKSVSQNLANQNMGYRYLKRSEPALLTNESEPYNKFSQSKWVI
jgi:hypothetical protein